MWRTLCLATQGFLTWSRNNTAEGAFLDINAPLKSSTELRLSIGKFEKFLLGGLTENVPPVEVEPEKELARFDDLAVGSPDKTSLAHASLTSYIRLWSSLLENGRDGSRGLTTSVTASSFEPLETIAVGTAPVKKASGIRIMFRPPKRYLSYSEQKNLDRGIVPDRKGAKLDAWSPGGIEVLVETLRQESSDDAKEIVRLVARRCGIDGDTVIKVTSERAVVRKLTEAVRIWVKMRETE